MKRDTNSEGIRAALTRPGVRRAVIRAAVAIAALAVLIAVPAILTGRGGFFGRYDGLAGKYDPWSKSTHVSASCQECHVSPRGVDRAVYRARMVGEFYVSLVNSKRVPQVFDSPTNAACSTCHYDLRSVSPNGDLKIPHRAHVTILKMDCVQCHDHMVHEKSPEGGNTPTMGGCLKCHDGDKAKDACSACHTEKSVPDTHKAASWVIEHPKQADDPECESCHKWVDDWCADCHSRRPRSHGADWRKVHRVQVEKHRSCEACHDSAFCTECHGEVPKLNFDPSLKIVR